MTWDLLWRKNPFLRQFKRLDKQTKRRVRKALEELAQSQDPANVGEYKQSMRAWAYNVGRQCRVLYGIEYQEHLIDLIKVGDHKAVYGSD